MLNVLAASWHMLQEASVYIVFGLVVGGLLKVFLSPAYVASHLGTGRFKSVFKAALFGIPIPLCSCGVLPAAASLKKQGANNGATTAFLISTPESGVDSISLSWALLDPIMTVFRPVSAFISAFVAGAAENVLHPPEPQDKLQGVLSCPVDSSMLLMLVIGIPLYICATASTPIAAAFILKGVSPGAAPGFSAGRPGNKYCVSFHVNRIAGEKSNSIIPGVDFSGECTLRPGAQYHLFCFQDIPAGGNGSGH